MDSNLGIAKKVIETALAASMEAGTNPQEPKIRHSSSPVIVAFPKLRSPEDWFPEDSEAKPFGDTRIDREKFRSLRRISKDEYAMVNGAFIARFVEILGDGSGTLGTEIHQAKPIPTVGKYVFCTETGSLVVVKNPDANLRELPLSSDDATLNDLNLSAPAKLCLRAAGELEKRKLDNQRRMEGKMGEIESALNQLEKYWTTNMEGPYMKEGNRPGRYKYTQRWREHAEQLEIGSSGESCFWAEVEELNLAFANKQPLNEQKALELAKKPKEWRTKEEVKKDAFLKETALVKWWQTLPTTTKQSPASNV
ncbi:hypothetical protein NL676_003218 [Syzygium grande]|nr:hypothetical protein NL676_003218 [Syzygium grande]